MATKRLDLKQMALAYGGASFAAVVAGSVSGGLWAEIGGNTNYSLWIGGSWLVVVGLPSMAVASDTLLRTLGKKSPIQIISNIGGNQGRKVPINYRNGRQSHVFLSALPMIGGRQPEPIEVPEVPQSFTVMMDDNHYQVPVSEIRDFLHTSWQRQRQGKPAFSRNWWTKTRRPKMHEKQYRALMLVLNKIDGIVINRGQGRSGKLALPPEATVKTLQGLM